MKPDLVVLDMAGTTVHDAGGIDDPARVAKVGDTPSDLQEGVAAGCGWVIGVTRGTHTCEQLVVFPHTHFLPCVADLPALRGL